MKAPTPIAAAVAAALVPLVLAAPATAHDDGRRTELFKPGVAHATTTFPAADAPAATLAAGYGDFGFASGTAVPEADDAFRRGIALLWGFNHAAAAEAFRAAQRLDPECSACYWGEAYALGPNLNDGMHEESVPRAIEVAALALEHAGTERERALAEALVRRYTPEGPAGEPFAEAMAEAAHAFPDDPNVQVVHADALMNLQPWDYWEADGVTPKGRGEDILAALERTLALDPEHPAALHLYIHAVEASADPGRAEDAADALRGRVAMAGHLVHMPAHIYNRIGRFEDSIAVNKAAIAADERYLEGAGEAASELYRYGYYPHNVHFLLVGAQMAGLESEALAAAEKLAGITSEDVSRELAWVQAIETAPYTVHAQFGTPEEILALPDPGDDFPFVRGHWHYARGVAHALEGNLDAALAEQEAIERIIAEADLDPLEEQYLPARDVLGIANHVLEARIAQACGEWASAEHHLEEAIALEDTIAYMEPPYWYYPVRQTLGAVRLQAGNPLGARHAFEEVLERQPNNAWALWGLWQIERERGDHWAEELAEDAFRDAWLGRERPAIERL